jgi:hypothetical protein
MLDDGVGATRDGVVVIRAEVGAGALDLENDLGADEHADWERE